MYIGALVIKEARAQYFIGIQAVFGFNQCMAALVRLFIKDIDSTCFDAVLLGKSFELDFNTCLGSECTSFHFNQKEKNSTYCCLALVLDFAKY